MIAGVAPGKKNDEFVVFDHPKISKLIPSLSLYGGSTQMRIIGENFYPGKNRNCGFQNISTGVELERVPAAVTKPTLVTCEFKNAERRRVPCNSSPRCRRRISIVTIEVTVYNKPRFEKVVPSIGPARGGSHVYIEHQI